MKKFYKSILTMVLALFAMAANADVIYSWDGNGITSADKFTGATGGTATPNGGDTNVVAGSKQKNNWCFKLGKGYEVKDANDETILIPTHYVEIALDNALKGGEEITFSAFMTADSKTATFGVDFDGANGLTYEVSEVLLENGVPTTEGKLTVPAEAAGCSKIRIYRKTGNTTIYVSKLVISSASDAPAAKVTITDMTLTVAEGEQIDEDGDFKVTFGYKAAVLDENVMAAGSFKISVFDADNNPVVEGEPWTFNMSQTSKNFYVSNLTGGKEYTVKVDEVVIKDNSKIDYETVMEGEEILKITEGLPTLKFTPIAGEVKAVEMKDMKMVADKNEVIDEEGDYAVAFNYTAKINDENLKAEDLACMIKYEVYDENFALVSSGSRDFNLAETSRSVYVSGLTAGKSYTLLVTSLVVLGESGEVLNMTDGLPKANFKVKDPNAQQVISMSNMKFVVAEGATIDEEGDFTVAFNYTATVNDPSAIAIPDAVFATVEYEVLNEAGEKVAGNVGQFEYQGTSKNLYISNLEAGKSYTIKATKVEIQDYMTMDMLCETTADLPTLTFTVAGATGIESVVANPASSKKFIENGKVVILKNGKKFNVAGVEVK